MQRKVIPSQYFKIWFHSDLEQKPKCPNSPVCLVGCPRAMETSYEVPGLIPAADSLCRVISATYFKPERVHISQQKALFENFRDEQVSS